jgi:hypothetical protein
LAAQLKEATSSKALGDWTRSPTPPGIVLPCTDGQEIRLRRITERAAEQKSLLQQIGLRPPERFELNRKCQCRLRDCLN